MKVYRITVTCCAREAAGLPFQLNSTVFVGDAESSFYQLHRRTSANLSVRRQPKLHVVPACAAGMKLTL